MKLTETSLRRQLMQMVLLTIGAVLLVATSVFFVYEYLTFRQTSVQQLNTLAKAIAANSTAALAFDNREDAESILAAFEADPHIVSAALYDRDGKVFAVYPKGTPTSAFPKGLEQRQTYSFRDSHLLGFQPVAEGDRSLGTLYLRSDLRALSERFRLYAWIVALVVAASTLLAYGFSRHMQRRISHPILELAEAATAVSSRRDYSVRVARTHTLEIDQLTVAFNHMLVEIQQSEARLRTQLSHLSLLQHITRAIGDRQDNGSIFRIVLQSLEQNLPIDFGCVCHMDDSQGALIVGAIGPASEPYAQKLTLRIGSELPIDSTGLSRCVGGQLLHEPDTRSLELPFPRLLADNGLASMVVVPLVVDSTFFGILIASRAAANAFTSAECEFLKQLTDHVSLAAQQTQLHNRLQKAYDDLRDTQDKVMQQERLRALGQMASGIAHDINNAISPVALYTESLLEREPTLSERARGQLRTIQCAIDDVAGTVARMREFYRQREPQLTLARVDLNHTIQQAVELTRARWSDLPQRRGLVVELRTELSATPAEVMIAEGELRDALTNLIFNAVDAMPEGGALTLRTRVVDRETPSAHSQVHIEVCDTGIGMDAATRERCLEPFFTTKGERGTGLGLAMVYGMIKRHSAELEIDSQIGHGTTFRLTFPAAARDSVAASIREEPRSFAGQLRILLVDDDPLLIQSLEHVLSTDGHRVTTANGGQAGIDTFAASRGSSDPFAVVITDLGMPHVDGRRVAAAIKAMSADTPVVMLTGWGQRLVAENDVPPDVDRVLNKPPRLHDLRTVLLELCQVTMQSHVESQARRELPA